jgi:hypothetical protein
MGKAPKSRAFAMAGPLLMAGAVLSACIIPQPDDPGPAQPTFQNRPPRIIAGLIAPAQQNGFSVGVIGCPAPDFHVYVSDDDTGDTIYSAWKATSLSGSTMSTSGWLSGTTAMPTGAVKRPTQIDPPLADPGGFFSTAPFMSTGLVRIDVTVSDGSFLLTSPLSENPVNIITLPDGGFLAEPAGTDSYTWIVTVVSCPP